MKYPNIFMKSFFFFGILSTLLLPQRAVCENPIIGALKDLNSNGIRIMDWSVLPNNDIALSLLFSDPSVRFRSFTAYAQISNQGEYIIKPDSIYSWIWMPSKNIVFDTNGALYMYKNPHDEPRVIYGYHYDPSLDAMETKKFEDSGATLGYIKGVHHLPGIGNVMYTSTPTLPINILIDDFKNEKLNKYVLDEDILEGFRYVGYSFVAYKQSDSKILIIGVSAPLTDSEGNWVVSTLTLDITTGEFELVDFMSHNELLSAGMLEYVLPAHKKAPIIEANGRLFYIIFIEPVDKLSGMSRFMFIELDRKGNFVTGDNKTSFEIEESAISETPEKFLLLRKGASKEEDKKFWMLSLDNFPRLIFDKGE